MTHSKRQFRLCFKNTTVYADVHMCKLVQNVQTNENTQSTDMGRGGLFSFKQQRQPVRFKLQLNQRAAQSKRWTTATSNGRKLRGHVKEMYLTFVTHRLVSFCVPHVSFKPCDCVPISNLRKINNSVQGKQSEGRGTRGANKCFVFITLIIQK